MRARVQKIKIINKNSQYGIFKILKSRLLINEIDAVLAEQYGFTEEELGFIINYDIKYRMGKELDAYIDGTLGEQELEE